MLQLGSPWLLLLALLTPALLLRSDGGHLFFGRRMQAGIKFSSGVQLSVLPQSRRLRERVWVLNMLRAATLLSLVIGLARPQTAHLLSETETSGRDIMLALDVSGSMNAIDFFIDGQRVDRLAALKYVMKKFVESRRGDRIGLIVFGTDVFTQCPLTTDQLVLQDFINSLEVGMVGDGTALGDAIIVSVKRLKDIEADSKVIVLVTDGVKTAGSVEPKEAAEVAKRAGIKIYSIGIGGNKPAPFRVTGMFGQPRLEYRPVELDEKSLTEISTLTGGIYQNAEKTEALEAVSSKVSELEERSEKTFEYFEYEEHFWSFVCFGFICFLLHELLSARRYLSIP